MPELSVPLPGARPDANHLALGVARRILGGAHDFEFTFDKAEFSVSVERLGQPSWPGPEGLSEELDGPWPAPVRLRCVWPGGAVTMLLEAAFWHGKGQYRHLVGLRGTVPAASREVLWITLALPLRPTPDGGEATVRASFVPFKKRGEQTDPTYARVQAAREVMLRAGLPFAADFQIEACRVHLPEGNVLPSPGEAFERLVRVAVLKLPFFLRDAEGIEGVQPFEVLLSATNPGNLPAPTPLTDGKRASVWPLPGGVRQYKETLDALLTEIAPDPMPLDRFHDLLRERYEVTGETARKGYVGVLTNLRLCRLADGQLTLTPEGSAYLEQPSARSLFERLHSVWAGVLEVLVIASALGRADTERTHQLLCRLLGMTWESTNQVSFRRNWLLSLGMTDRSAEGDELTNAGREALEGHRDEVTAIRTRLDDMLDDLGSNAEDDDDELDADNTRTQVAPGLDALQPKSRGEPSAWSADRVDLRPEMVAPFAKELELPSATIASAVAALSAGKHLLLVGPPGTGKTELAHALIGAARAENYCAGAFVATASADWTTFDTIGGYALQRDGSLRFRSGALLRAIEQWQWLVIDELNRTDVDRSFGELMTVLAGRTTDTAYELDGGRTVRIGPDPEASHPMPRTFRVIATMNTWDKTSLFRLSYAVQRRFAIVNVGVPGDAAYGALVRRHCEQGGPDPALDAEASASVGDLFSSRGLIGIRAIGPAVALDVIRYVRRRAAGRSVAVADAIAEALGMLVLPQLEGLDQDDAARAFAALTRATTGENSSDAQSELRQRFAELFPHVKLPA